MFKSILIIVVSILLSCSQVSGYYDGTIDENRGGQRGDSYGGARIG